MNSCRVVEAPLVVPARAENEATKSIIRDGLEPSLKTMTDALSTVGVVYKASVSLASRRSESSADSRLMDGAKFFAPSPADDLEITPVVSDENVSSDDQPANESPTNERSDREVYDFKYTLNGSETVALPDADLKLKIGATGNVEVREGEPRFLSFDVVAEVYSRSATDPNLAVAKFKIANLSRIGHSDSQKIEVSFSEYRRLIRWVNMSKNDAENVDAGVLELVITKESATLSVNDFILDSDSNLRFETMSAIWTFSSGSFNAGAKLSFIDRNHEKFGINVSLDKNSEIVTKLWKYESTDVESPPSTDINQPLPQE